MTRENVADGELGQFARQVLDLVRRVNEGTIPVDTARRAVQAIIEDEFRFGDGGKAEEPSVVSRFKPWRTLKLGTGLKTADDFREAIKKAGGKIGGWANDILGRSAFTAATEETEVDLYLPTTAELTGKPEGGTTAEVFAGAAWLGFKKCPPEVGPQLRIQYPDQPMDDRLLIGMEPIAGSDGDLYVFDVGRHGDDQWLSADCDYAGKVWDGNCRWVLFLLRHR